MATLDSGGTRSNDHGIDRAAQKPQLITETSVTKPGLDIGADSGRFIGTVFDKRFRILERLGSGGMSEVYRAEHLILQKQLAVKVLHPEETAKENSIERFQQEAKAVSALDHANIVKVYAFSCAEGGQLYLAMDLIEGCSLADIIIAEGAMSWKRTVGLCMQIAQGLEHAHSRGVIHRDLKPSNIIVQKDAQGNETVKIVDFGIARLTEQSGKELKQLTLAGRTCGSPPYMSPEQCMGQNVDQRSDIYSFGCMIYEMLSGKRPFYAQNNMELMHMQLRQSPKRFKLLSAELEIPEALEAIVRKCLSKSAAHRYQRMQDLYDDLAHIGSQSEEEQRLKNSLEKESLKNCKVEVLKFCRNIVLPSAVVVLLLSVAGLMAWEHLPQIKIWQMQNKVAAITAADPDRLSKLFALVPQLAEQEMKAGFGDAAFLRLRALEKELKLMPVSRTQCHYLAKLARTYNKFGRLEEGRALTEETLATLESYIQKCNLERNFADLEPAAMEVLSICRDDLSKQDHLIGQYNILIPMYIWRQQYNVAEKLSRTALQQIKSHPQPNDTAEISMLLFLSETLIPQAKLLQAEQSLQRAWQLCLNGWTADSLIAQRVGKKLLECYRAQGKEKEATELASLLTPQ